MFRSNAKLLRTRKLANRTINGVQWFRYLLTRRLVVVRLYVQQVCSSSVLMSTTPVMVTLAIRMIWFSETSVLRTHEQSIMLDKHSLWVFLGNYGTNSWKTLRLIRDTLSHNTPYTLQDLSLSINDWNLVSLLRSLGTRWSYDQDHGKHYKRSQLGKWNLNFQVNRRRLEESEFETWDLDQPALDQRWDLCKRLEGLCVSSSRWDGSVDPISLYGWHSWRLNVMILCKLFRILEQECSYKWFSRCCLRLRSLESWVWKSYFHI